MKTIIMLLSNPCDPDPRVQYEAEALAKRYKVKIIGWDRENKSKLYEVKNKVIYERIKYKSTYGHWVKQIFPFIKFQFLLFKKLQKEDADIVHCHDFDTLVAGFLFAKLNRKKIIYDSHEHYSALKNSFLSPILRLTEKIIIPFLDARITVSEDLGNALFKSYNFTLIMTAKLKEKLKKKKFDKPTFFYAGTLSKDHYLDELIEVFNKVDANFLLAGDTGDMKYKKNLLKKIKAQNIKYLGKLSYKKVKMLTTSSDFIVCLCDSKNKNSLFSMPNKFFEAIAFKKPILINKYTAAGKIVLKENLGFAIDPETELKQTITKMVKGDVNSYEIKKNLEKAQKKYNWENEKEKLLNLYQELSS